ncbi:GGDEF domain-containing protein [Rhodococcus sp. PAMC28707]|uniref:GGDEF domain-containing protein n=1 Tax=unclassified Rhodococcus (in: high G+C Gram-positive bacteria) TaxID=192944 RepID=UPI00109DD2D7|nr:MULTISPECIES: GGDEF domain-containing protein [unclassified Rhodococcus (in: high G+C Gram-positive bacteria)]QCB52373.1 GGDEF domain-containing protein [Rhodococcus sp. PAMC28705]QCB59457.1 GGDEF domain-containing protein [Rhodococcus sp. PAMC28707]
MSLSRQALPSRRPPAVGAWKAVVEWLTAAHDYEWMREFQNSHRSGKVIRLLIALSMINISLMSFLSLYAAGGPSGPAATIWTLTLCTTNLIVAALWILLSFPGRLGVVLFALYADLGIASTLVLFELGNALLGCVLFAVIGAFVTFFTSPRWVVLHLVFASAVVLGIAGALYLQGRTDTLNLLVRTNVVLLAIMSVPITSHIFLTTLSADARSSVLDPLTGLLNRRGLTTAIEDLLPQGQRHGWCAAVVVVDIDNFKSVNDIYGHDEGDAVICRVAERLTTHVSRYGVVGRTGGEEYLAAVVTSRLHIDALIHGVRRALHGANDAIPVTASIGAAILYAESDLWTDSADPFGTATRVADSMMYQAKAAGGNRVVTTLI